MDNAKLELVFLRFANRLLDAQAGKENPTLGNLIDTAVNQVKLLQPQKPERLIGEVDTFGKYTIRIDADTAGTLLELVQQLDFQAMTKAQVMAMNGLQLNLQAIKEEIR